MRYILFSVFLLFQTFLANSQDNNSLFNDSLLKHASISAYIEDISTGEIILDHNSEEGVVPASVLKLFTTAAALELLGPDHTFKTTLAYSGSINKRNGELEGDIVIKGGGDPSLGSKNFPEYYDGFTDKWIDALKKRGIKKIDGNVITDDSYFDYQPIPAKWLWEDEGNYYGAGVFGLSVFDNTYEIHLDTYSDSTRVKISSIVPRECRIDLSSQITLSENTDMGYVFSAPYATNGWLAGTLPINRNDLVLRASINDPPLLMARLMYEKLKAAGIKISGIASTTRLLPDAHHTRLDTVSVIQSPPLSDILEVLNHKSVNLYAEHLVKELGKVFGHEGSTSEGIKVIYQFLNEAGLSSEGIFIVDGSGLSPANIITSKGLVSLLVHMRKSGKYFPVYYNSLALPGEGTLRTSFSDAVFNSKLSAKSGSMTRVRSFSGYITSLSGRQMAFTIIVNNFTGASSHITSLTENLLKSIMLSR
jgi:D-alanyl-D-alanine carboxypeptidase/D-alanyl-D-alanine-endopeptidase (penicillin-binding protein 4)